MKSQTKEVNNQNKSVEGINTHVEKDYASSSMTRIDLKWFTCTDENSLNARDEIVNASINPPKEDENCIALIFPLVQKNGTVNFTEINSSLTGFEFDRTLTTDTRFNDYVICTFDEHKNPVKSYKHPSKDKTSICKSISLFKRKDFTKDDEVINFYQQLNQYQEDMYCQNQLTNQSAINKDAEGAVKSKSKFVIPNNKVLKLKWLNDLEFTLANMRIYLFDSGIGFISVFFRLTDKNKTSYTESNIFDIYSAFYKYIPMKKALKDLIDTYAKIVLEYYVIIESNEDKNKKPDTYGASIFASLCFATKKDMSDSIIPLWFTGKHSLKSTRATDYVKLINDNILIDASIEGCCTMCFFNPTNKDCKKYYNRNARFICQHSFLSYILVLHQRYFYDRLAEKVKKINKIKKYQLMFLTEDYINEYLHFKNMYSFENVSMVSKYQTIYETYKKELKIIEIDGSVSGTVGALHNISEKFVERKKAFMLAMLSAVTGLNGSLGIFNAISNDGYKLHWAAVVFPSIGCFLIVSILLIFFLPNGLSRKIHLSKLNKSVDK